MIRINFKNGEVLLYSAIKPNELNGGNGKTAKHYKREQEVFNWMNEGFKVGNWEFFDQMVHSTIMTALITQKDEIESIQLVSLQYPDGISRWAEWL